ncbi:MAG: hypothetical protein H6686_12755 [Fibrobacteria bacterium]|nr:hypothetical protein [Fibrobacteria bacterium]
MLSILRWGSALLLFVAWISFDRRASKRAGRTSWRPSTTGIVIVGIGAAGLGHLVPGALGFVDAARSPTKTRQEAILRSIYQPDHLRKHCSHWAVFLPIGGEREVETCAFPSARRAGIEPGDTLEITWKVGRLGRLLGSIEGVRRRQDGPKPEDPRIQRNSFGFSISDSTSSCHVRLFATPSKGHIRIQESVDCDPEADSARMVRERLVATLLSEATPATVEHLSWQTTLTQSPLRLERWCRIVARSPAWKNRPAKAHSWETTEYPLIRKIMDDSLLFASQIAFLEGLGWTYQGAGIEKTGYVASGTLPFFDSILEPMGVPSTEGIPVPNYIQLDFRRTLCDTCPPIRGMRSTRNVDPGGRLAIPPSGGIRGGRDRESRSPALPQAGIQAS